MAFVPRRYIEIVPAIAYLRRSSVARTASVILLVLLVLLCGVHLSGAGHSAVAAIASDFVVQLWFLMSLLLVAVVAGGSNHQVLTNPSRSDLPNTSWRTSAISPDDAVAEAPLRC